MAERLSEIKCGHCGAASPLTARFCRVCGKPLDFDRAERELLRPRRRGCFGRMVRGAVLLALFAGVGMAVWPVRRVADAGGAVDARRYAMTRALLEDALDRGEAMQMAVAARDFNAFLASNVKDSGSGGEWAAHYRGAGVDFGEGEGVAWLEMERGPFTLTCECIFGVEGGTLKATGARFGHLPLPGELGRLFLRSRKDVWGVFGAERRILGGLERAELHDGVLTVRTRGD